MGCGPFPVKAVRLLRASHHRAGPVDRRAHRHGRRGAPTGGCALHLDTFLAGRTLPLTPTEFRVLLCLAEHAGTMLPYAHLVRCAQGYDADELEAGELIKPHIHHLRQKLEPDPTAPRYILNVRGKGYLLSPVGE